MNTIVISLTPLLLYVVIAFAVVLLAMAVDLAADFIGCLIGLIVTIF